jgi:membrane protease YdiL (CAAX protease family)
LITFAGTFLISIFLVGGFAAFGLTPTVLQKSASDKSLFLILNQTLLSIGLLAYLAAQMRVRFQSPFWRTVGWRPLDTGTIPRRIVYLSLILGGFALSLLIQIASAALQNKAKMPIETFFQDRRSAFLLMLMGVLIAPLVEETIFRGYIYPVVARSFGIRAGVVITGTMFGLLHAPQLWGGWGQIALLIVVGIIFTAARAILRTVVASYLLHVSYNSFLFIAFLVASHGLRHLPVGP